MQNGFTRGLIIGSIIGASISMMMDPDVMKSKNRKRMMRVGRNFLRKSGHIIGDVVEMFR